MKALTISDRIASLLSDKKLSAIELSKIIQVQRSTLSHILSGRNKPSLDLIERFHNAFPELSLEWLITGVGSMYKGSESTPKSPTIHPEVSVKEIPVPNKSKESEGPVIYDHQKPVNIPSAEPVKSVTVKDSRRIAVKTIIVYSDDTFEMFTSLNL